jgi:transcriptional regulator with XRE-family HTH domain
VKDAGWTQAKAAEQLGVSQPRMNDLLRGRLSKFSLDALVNLVSAAGRRVHVELEAVRGVVGSNPAGRAKFQRLGSENQVLLVAVGPSWNELSTGPGRRVAIHALGVQNQVLLPLLWNSVGVLIHTPALPFRDPYQRPRAGPIDNQVCLRQ